MHFRIGKKMCGRKTNTKHEFSVKRNADNSGILGMLCDEERL